MFFRSRTHFQWNRERHVPLSCFALSDLFSAILRASGPILILCDAEVPRASSAIFRFCAPGPDFGNTEGVGSHFNVLRSQTHFRRYRGRQISLSCFAFSDRFSAVPRASVLIFMFCACGFVFGVIEDVGSRFNILRSHTHFRRYRARRVPFSCFAFRTHVRRYHGRGVPFSCFPLPDSFSAEPGSSDHAFLFCAVG
jgi:hypothetical protein